MWRMIGLWLSLCPLAVEASGWVITESRIKTRTVIRAAPPRMRWNINGDWSPTESQTRIHLEREHGVSTSGKTHQQLLDLHDSLHEGRSRTVRQRYRTRSSCPGGVCPPQRPKSYAGKPR